METEVKKPIMVTAPKSLIESHKNKRQCSFCLDFFEYDEDKDCGKKIDGTELKIHKIVVDNRGRIFPFFDVVVEGNVTEASDIHKALLTNVSDIHVNYICNVCNAIIEDNAFDNSEFYTWFSRQSDKVRRRLEELSEKG